MAFDEGATADNGMWPTAEDDDAGRQLKDQATVRPPGLASGMAFCIPTLSLIGLLYSLLK